MASDEPILGEDDTEVLQFNLTNPDQLSQQLDAARLDEDETDALLKEALRINAQLKETLRLQQLEESGDTEVGRRQPRNHHIPSEPLAPRNPKQSILPPIVHSDRSLSGGSGSRRIKGDSKSRSFRDPQRLGSASKHKSSPPDQKKKRPPWDDRFSFG